MSATRLVLRSATLVAREEARGGNSARLRHLLAGAWRNLRLACGEFACLTRPTALAGCAGGGGRRPPKPGLAWRKLAWGPFVLVLSPCGGRRRALSTVPCAQAAATMIAGEPAAPYHRTVPIVVGAPPDLERIRASHLAAGPVWAPAGGTAVLRHVTLAASGVILTADGRVVAESLLNTEDWGAFGGFRRAGHGAPLTTRTAPLSLQRRLRSRPVVMMKQSFDANYGHWLVESLPRLAGAAAVFNPRDCTFVVAAGHGPMQAMYIDSLGACGIRRDQVVALNYAPVHVDVLVYPLPITRHPWVKSPAVVPFLEALAGRMPRRGQGPSRIYASRNRGATRRLLNEEAVVALARSYGFVVVHPETMSFADQVAMFRDAEVVVGPYGANLSNVVFAPPGVALFALTTQAMQDDFFWDLMDHKRGRYASLHGRAATNAANAHSDFSVDLGIFARMLRECLWAQAGNRPTPGA